MAPGSGKRAKTQTKWTNLGAGSGKRAKSRTRWTNLEVASGKQAKSRTRWINPGVGSGKRAKSRTTKSATRKESDRRGVEDIGPISEMSFGELTNGHFMDTGKSFMAFIAGAAVGAVAALLMAPESGAKTREKIRSGAAEAAGAAKAKIIEGLDMLEAALEKEE